MDDTAVGTDRNIDAGLLKILVSRLCDLDDCSRLTAADALGLAGDADGTAADADLHEVCACLCQEQETVAVDDIARADLDTVAVGLADPFDGAALPLAEAFGGINADHVHAGFHQRRDTLRVVSGIDACADDIALVFIQKLVHIFLVAVIVLAEHHVLKVSLFIDQRKGIDLVFPDDVVAVVKAGGGRCGDQLFKGRHELRDLQVLPHSGEPVVAGSDDAEKLSVGGAVFGDGHGGVTGAGLQLQDVRQGRRGRKVGIAGDEALLILLYAAHHVRFTFDALRSVDEGNAALLCQRDGEVVPGDRLHDCRDHGDIHSDRAFFRPLPEFDQRSLQTHGCRNAFGR